MKERHHFRPVLHLREFADPRGLVWTYDQTGHAKPFQQHPKNIGYERLLYSPRVEGVEPNDSLENWFEEHVDRPAGKVLTKAASETPLDSLEGSALCRFVAAQDMRTPRARDDIIALFQMAIDQQFDEWRKDPVPLQAAILRDSGEDISLSELADLLARRSAQVNNVAWFEFITGHVEMAAERLFNMGWSLFGISSEREFVTNDVGIVKCLGRFDRPFRYGLGFLGGRSHWVFPLTPHRAFLFQPSRDGIRAEASDSWITAINAQFAADAQRFVYSRSYSANLASVTRPPAT